MKAVSPEPGDGKNGPFCYTCAEVLAQWGLATGGASWNDTLF